MKVSLYEHMENHGLLEYGKVITIEEIYDVLGIKVPEKGTQKEYRDIELIVLGATGAVRDNLQQNGKTFQQNGCNYRIPLLSEMSKVVDSYFDASMKKTKRASLLLASVPWDEAGVILENEAKWLIHRLEIKKNKRKKDDLN